jgi:Ca-activated chloride channel family protein
MDIRFADPWILLLLIALPALALFAFRYRRSGGLLPFGTVAPAPAGRRTWRMRLEPMLTLLRIAAVAALIAAVARPQRGEAITRAELEGIDIALAYDVSSSMTQPFGAGVSRRDAAEDVLTRFILERDGDRVGLIVFQGSTIVLSPLTTDYHAVTEALADAPRLRLPDGTTIGGAIAGSLSVLRDSDSASRVVILLTDGDNNSDGIEPLAAARLAQELGIRVYTIGVVSPSLTNQSQSTLNVDETALKEIANVTGGTYNRAEDPGALAEIYENIDALEKSRFEGAALTRYVDVAPYLLAAAAAVLAIEVILRVTWFRRVA